MSNHSVYIIGATGPTGAFETVNIDETGPTGLFETVLPLPGPTGPTGTYQTLIGAVGATGRRHVILVGSGIPPSVLNDGSGGTYNLRADGLYVHSTNGALFILCGDSDGAFGVDINGNYYAQAYP